MRKLLTLIVAVFIVISCNNQNQSKVIDTSKNEKIINQYFEYFNSHNWKKMAEMYTETADFKDPSLGKGIVKQTRKPTPFSFPIMVDRLREQLTSEKLDDRIQKMIKQYSNAD